jgi:hypothetical protein
VNFFTQYKTVTSAWKPVSAGGAAAAPSLVMPTPGKA